MDHKHWFEPPSLEVVVERGIRIYEETPHTINYFHCPVPKSATAQYGPSDNLEAYLAPLKDLVPYLGECRQIPIKFFCFSVARAD
jgi:hypothetical protein